MKSMKDRLKEAQSETEVNALLAEMGSYTYISSQTRNACRNTAKRKVKASRAETKK